MCPSNLTSNRTNPEDNGRPLSIQFSNRVMSLTKGILALNYTLAPTVGGIYGFLVNLGVVGGGGGVEGGRK